MKMNACIVMFCSDFSTSLDKIVCWLKQLSRKVTFDMMVGSFKLPFVAIIVSWIGYMHPLSYSVWIPHAMRWRMHISIAWDTFSFCWMITTSTFERHESRKNIKYSLLLFKVCSGSWSISHVYSMKQRLWFLHYSLLFLIRLWDNPTLSH